MSRKKYYAAVRFTRGDVGKTYVFRDRYDGRLYSFELLDCVSMPLRELNEQFPELYHIKPEVVVEQIWCRIKPDFDRDRLVVGFEEEYGEIYTDDANGPLAFGLQMDPDREIGKNAFTCSTLKPSVDDAVEWKLEVWDA